MPTVLRIDGYRFFFYSDEHTPIHIHVKKGGARARIILEPELQLSYNHGFNPGEMKKIFTIIVEHYKQLITAWNEAFNQ